MTTTLMTRRLCHVAGRFAMTSRPLLQQSRTRQQGDAVRLPDLWTLRSAVVRRTARVRAALPAAPATPLCEAEIGEAEAQFGVTMPAGYRDFLIHVDSGGHGPGSGFRRLRRDRRGWAWEGWPDEPGTDLDALTKPFPDQADIGARLDALLEPAVHGSREWRGWDERCDEIAAGQTHGTIVFAGDSTFPLLLVVTGPQRGTVWCDLRATTEALALLRKPDGSAATFTDLYVAWLDAAEQLLDEGRTELRPWDIRVPMIDACFQP
ncbi:SMI1/KNR4 family protein [Actinoplanes sp. NPDC024001]|uniref:SMI1/KNR4 family protein n=1 Tax=Actinoplanes sp. NPDC024001 TaxID=3154598 RepID=UPI003404BF31